MRTIRNDQNGKTDVVRYHSSCRKKGWQPKLPTPVTAARGKFYGMFACAAADVMAPFCAPVINPSFFQSFARWLTALTNCP